MSDVNQLLDLLPFLLAILIAVLISVAYILLNVRAFRRKNKWIGIIIFLLTMPPSLFLIYSLVIVILAVVTNDMKYAFSDMVFGLMLIVNIIWLPIIYMGFRVATPSASPREQGGKD